MNFNKLGLTEELLEAVSKKGYTEATPIQAQAIPAVLDGNDVLGGAQTGTGKTAAFALPILHKIHVNPVSTKTPRALILTPTRELAAQVHQSFIDYGQNVSVKSHVIFGGVKINPQIDALKRKTDVIVATPGRLLDHVSQKTIDLSHVEVFVLDEADRMLDMGFIRDIQRIQKVLPKQRQNLMFSATYSKDIRILAEQILHKPIKCEVAQRNQTADNVLQVRYAIDKNQKRHLLEYLVKKDDWYRVLVFVRTKHGANRLAKQLQKAEIPCAAIHGDKSQNARTKALDQFKKGNLQALIATDVAARGIHLEELGHVVNFDLPQVPEDYIHRIGRTGRAGKSGTAISFVSNDEKDMWKRIEKLLKTPVEQLPLGDFKPVKIVPQSESSDRSSASGPSYGRSSTGQKPARPGQGNGQRTANKGYSGGYFRNKKSNNEFAGNKSEGNRSFGNRADGNRADGNRSFGNRSFGNRADGNRADGNRSFGNRSDGNRSNGNRSDGNRANGNRADGNRADGNRADGNRADGNRADGNRSGSNDSAPKRYGQNTSQANRPANRKPKPAGRRKSSGGNNSGNSFNSERSGGQRKSYRG